VCGNLFLIIIIIMIKGLLSTDKVTNYEVLDFRLHLLTEKLLTRVVRGLLILTMCLTIQQA
jgi:hypothetical protein